MEEDRYLKTLITQCKPDNRGAPHVAKMLRKGRSPFSPGRAGGMEGSKVSCPDGAGTGGMTMKEEPRKVESSQGSCAPD